VDIELAIKHVSEYLDLCVQGRSIVQAERAGNYRRDELTRIESDLTSRLPIVESIAAAVDERIAALLRTPDPVIKFRNRTTASTELLGALQSQDELARIHGTAGPKLAAADLHAWVWDHAARLWDDGHPREAVRAAATAIFDSHLPAALGLPKDTPQEALVAAFKTDPPKPGQPRLRIPGYTDPSDDFQNAQQGAQNLGLACAKLVRNLSAHTVVEHDENEALEELAMLSRFSRLVTSSRLETASAEK
jgi:hypothetical protein